MKKLMPLQVVGMATLAALLSVAPAAAKTKARTEQFSPAARRLLSEGLDRLKTGEYTAAISAFNKAVRTQPTVSSYFLLGWAHYQRGFKHGAVENADRDDAQSAIDAYRMALDMDPNLSRLPDAYRLHFSLALCEEAVGAYEPALVAYKAALTAAPNKALIPLHAARLRLKMKDEDKALANVQMSLAKARRSDHEGALIAAAKRDPSFAPLLADEAMRKALGITEVPAPMTVASNLDFRGEEMRDAVSDAPAPVPVQDPAVVDKISEGDAEFKFRHYLNAAAAYTEALQLNKNTSSLPVARVADLYEKIGTAYNKVGQSDQAIDVLQKSVQANPLDSDAHYQLALSYAISGKNSASLHALKEAFSTCSDPKELRRLVLLAKTDVELEAVRDLPAFAQVIAQVSDRIALS